MHTPCCTPVVFARFPADGSACQVFDRHTGPLCAGTFDRLTYSAWYHQGRHLVAEYNVKGITNG